MPRPLFFLDEEIWHYSGFEWRHDHAEVIHLPVRVMPCLRTMVASAGNILEVLSESEYLGLDVVLLPGMDGTGRLYSRLIQALPRDWRSSALKYPADIAVGYDGLLSLVQSMAPERPFLMVAESYSTPLAIRFAATRPDHLKGLVLCAGFVSSPIRGWLRFVARCLSRLLFYLPRNRWVIEGWLLGGGADRMLVDEVRDAISFVRPQVLAARLQEILECHVVADLARINVPILYLQADHDRLVGRKCLAEIEPHASQLKVERIFGPHLLCQSEPIKTAEAIIRFAVKQ